MLSTEYNNDIIKLLEEFNFRFITKTPRKYIAVSKEQVIYLLDDKTGLFIISNERFIRLIQIHKFIKDSYKEKKLHLTFEL